jgi:hypothetical protein
MLNRLLADHPNYQHTLVIGLQTYDGKLFKVNDSLYFHTTGRYLSTSDVSSVLRKNRVLYIVLTGKGK